MFRTSYSQCYHITAKLTNHLQPTRLITLLTDKNFCQELLTLHAHDFCSDCQNSNHQLHCNSAISCIHDDVTCSKFTTKPRLRNIFSKLLFLGVIFTWVFFSSLLLWEFKFMIKFKICILRVRLGGDLAALMSSHIRAIYSIQCDIVSSHIQSTLFYIIVIFSVEG